MLAVLDLKTGKTVKQYRSADLGEGAGLERPIVSADGRQLFATGNSKLFRYKLNGDDVKLADATDAIIKGRFEGISLSNDADFVSAPSGGGNVGAGEYSTFVYSSDNLKKPVCTIASGFFPLAVGFDVKAGLIYAQNLKCAVMVFDTKGAKIGEIEKLGGGPQVIEFLVHPAGGQVLVLSNPGSDPKAEARDNRDALAAASHGENGADARSQVRRREEGSRGTGEQGDLVRTSPANTPKPCRFLREQRCKWPRGHSAQPAGSRHGRHVIMRSRTVTAGGEN